MHGKDMNTRTQKNGIFAWLFHEYVSLERQKRVAFQTCTLDTTSLISGDLRVPAPRGCEGHANYMAISKVPTLWNSEQKVLSFNTKIRELSNVNETFDIYSWISYSNKEYLFFQMGKILLFLWCPYPMFIRVWTSVIGIRIVIIIGWKNKKI